MYLAPGVIDSAEDDEVRRKLTNRTAAVESGTEDLLCKVKRVVQIVLPLLDPLVGRVV
jgi:hypothetical protein